MNRTAMILATLAALAGCATTGGQPPPHGKLGATSGDVVWRNAADLPAITGNNASIVLYQTSAGRGAVVAGYYSTIVRRIVFSGRCDQAITLLLQVQHTGDATWRTVNGWTTGTDPVQGHPSGCTDASPGRGLGDTVAANTDVTCDMFAGISPTVRVVAATGGTGPTNCPYDLGIEYDRGLAQ